MKWLIIYKLLFSKCYGANEIQNYYAGIPYVRKGQVLSGASLFEK